MAQTQPKTKSKSHLWPIYVILLFIILALASLFAAKDGLVKFFNVDDNKDKTVVIGQRGADGKAGVNGVDGSSGSSGQNGDKGSNGSSGANGAQGIPGSNDCISGICVSRQASTPGTQEAGNINIDGALIATQAGIGTNSPSNTLSVAGTANFGGHSATGAGATVNGITSASDAVSGATAHNTIAAVYETVTTLDSATTMYEGLGGVLKLNPSAAPLFNQLIGNNGGVEVVAGNAEDFGGGALQGMNGSFIHAGTGTVGTAVSLQGPFLNLSTGTITNGYGVRSIGINFNSGTITNYTGIDSAIAINLGTITNHKGIQIQTPNNFGTITNNYGLYIQDQSSVGSSNSYNFYSDGATAKNYMGGTLNVQGHSAFGAGSSVNGYTDVYANLIGLTSSAISSNYETAALSSNTTGYNAVIGGLKLNPGGAPQYGLVTAGYFSTEITSGNAQNFAGNPLSGNTSAVLHSGTGTIATANGTSNALLIVGTGTITNGNVLNTAGINLGGTFTYLNGLNIGVPTNTGTITNLTGINVSTPNNFGTVTNNIGIRINDQSSVGSSSSFNFYSDGANSKNYFAGLSQIRQGQASVAGLTFYDSNFAIGMSGTDLALTTISGASNGISFTNNGVGGTPMMRIRGDGNVGIGTSAPTVPLEVNGAIRAVSLEIYESGGPYQLGKLYYDGTNADNNARGLVLSSAGFTAGTPNIQMKLANATNFYIRDNNDIARVNVEAAGNVGIGTGNTAPAMRLDVEDNTQDANVVRIKDTDGTCDLNPEAATLTITCSSDSRLKTNIRSAASVLSQINGLQIHDYTITASGDEATGLIAQEVLQTNPSMVHMGDDGYYKVDSYNPWKVLKGIQELSSGMTDINTNFASALTKTNGDMIAANELLTAQGLKIDQLSATLEEFATRLSAHDARLNSQDAKIQQLEDEISQLRQQNSVVGTGSNNSTSNTP